VVAGRGSHTEAAKLICSCFSVLNGVACAIPLGAPPLASPFENIGFYVQNCPTVKKWDNFCSRFEPMRYGGLVNSASMMRRRS
jgi:hypothetical protein